MTTPSKPQPEGVGGRYVPRGFSAIDPLALSIDYAAPAGLAATAPATEPPPFATVRISGPLTYEFTAPQCFDTYDFIRCRFDAALSSKPQAIILRIASPGGDVSGSFELARYMRRKAKEAGVKLIAHSDAQICSAAYVIACAASKIYCTETASIGSIGVIVQPVSTAVAEAAQGIKFAIISSGERKADGNPHVPLTPEARAAIQTTVDEMADVFFEHVGASRGERLTADGARALQAGVRVGRAALEAGLVDGVLDFEALAVRYQNAEPDESLAAAGGIVAVSLIAASAAAPALKASALAKASEDDKKDEPEKKEDAVRASLVTASTSDDEQKAARAKRALASYDSDEEDGDDKKKEAKARAEAAAAVAAQAAVSASAATLAEVSARLAAFEAKALSDERAVLFASRPDLPKAALEAVKDLPIATAKGILDSIPKMQGNPLAPAAVRGVMGDPTLPAGASPLTAEQSLALDREFGLAPKAAVGTRMNGIIQEFGVFVPAAPGSNAQ